MLFNRTPVRTGNSIPTPSQDAIENSLTLRQVSLEDAVRYGGSITRNALGAMKFKGDRKNIVVDTKVHFLLPGMSPSIPGWHTDGVPRGPEKDPAGTGTPSIATQEIGGLTPPRYHLLVTGTHCPTRFLVNPINFFLGDLREGGWNNLYANMTRLVNENIEDSMDGVEVFDSPDSTVLEWDWWNIHTATVATARGWRYLIRVTETDHITPRTNPADFIRTQNNVYTPIEYGW